MADRKASEILLELEQRISNIENGIKLQEFQLKIIINNFNKFFQLLEKKPITNIEEAVMPAAESVAKNESIIEKKNKLMRIQNSSITPKLEKQDKTEYNFNVRRRNNDANIPENKVINNNVSTTDGEKKIPVTQKLILFDGEPMTAAKVLIKNSNDEVIKTVETSVSGRWQTALVPGKYSINVSGKHGGSTIGFNQSFEVPNINSPLELPAPQAYKKIK